MGIENAGEDQQDFSLEIRRIDDELPVTGDVGSFLAYDLGFLIASERPVSMKEILDYKAGSLRTRSPEAAERQRIVHEKALSALVAAGVIVQAGDTYFVAESGAGKAWIHHRIESGDMDGVIEIAKDFLGEQKEKQE